MSRGGEAAMVGSAVSNNKLFLFSVSRAEDGLDGFNRFEASWKNGYKGQDEP